jgi:hypothetical protein
VSKENAAVGFVSGKVGVVGIVAILLVGIL